MNCAPFYWSGSTHFTLTRYWDQNTSATWGMDTFPSFVLKIKKKTSGLTHNLFLFKYTNMQNYLFFNTNEKGCPCPNCLCKTQHQSCTILRDYTVISLWSLVDGLTTSCNLPIIHLWSSVGNSYLYVTSILPLFD